MPADKYDAVIVGARPAGAATAAFLARAGFRVLLTDRVTFPKATISSPLFFANTLEILGRLGLSPHLGRLTCPPLKLYQVQLEDIQLRGRMMPFRGLDYTLQIRREHFDDIFFRHVAAMRNVEIRTGFACVELIWEDGRVVGIRGRRAGGSLESVRAEIVVGADGCYSTVAKLVRAQEYNRIPARTCAYYAYYSDIALAASEPCAALYYRPSKKFVFATANSECGLTVISISLSAAEFERARLRHESLHAEYLVHVPELAERMRNARRETPVYGLSPRDSFYRVPYGSGWVLVGDAGLYKDPLPGQGIHDALRSAELVAAAYAEFRQNGASPNAWNRAFKEYQTIRDSETKDMYALTDYLANLDKPRAAWELDIFRGIAAMPEWSNRYVSIFNGVTDPAWLLRFSTLVRIFAEAKWQRLKDRYNGATVSAEG